MILIKRIILFIFIIIPVYLFSYEFNIYDYEIVKEFSIGCSKKKLGYRENIKAGDTAGPSGIGFDVQGNCYICDYWNERIVIIDKNFNYIKELLLKDFYIMASAKQLFTDETGIWGYSDALSIAKIDYNGNKIFEIEFWNDKLSEKLLYLDFFIYKNYFFYYLEDGGFIFLNNLDKDNKKNRENIIFVKNYTDFAEKASDLFYNKNLSISRDNKLIENNQIITNNYRKYLNFHKRQNQTSNKNHIYDPDYFSKYSVVTYLGKDKNKWTYFIVDIYKAIIVFNADGCLVDAFQPLNFRFNILPAVNPDGDIFFLDVTAKHITLCKISCIASSLILIKSV